MSECPYYKKPCPRLDCDPPGYCIEQQVANNPSTNTKPSNPKDAIGVLKVGLSFLPTRVLYDVALGMLEGALKYGRHNYRVKSIGVRASVYYDATKRHVDDWWEGEDIDKASNLNHITKAISSLIVLRDAMLRDNWVDDRPPRCAPGWMDDLNAKAKALIEKYPNPAPAYTELNTRVPYVSEGRSDGH